jgi:hypothetical protein
VTERKPAASCRGGRAPWIRLVGMAALLALALASLGSAASWPTTTDAGRSASHVTSTASGQCSKAEAIEAVRRLGLRDVSAAYPVWKVLCGAFTGAGSRVMVASISGSENVGMLYWAVFRWTGSEWRFLMKQRRAAVLTAAGSDIKETVSIYRPSDSRCCPSGGTTVRIWHWNGSRFVAGREQSTTHMFYFESPSHNIWCDSGDEGQAYCATKTPPRSVTLSLDGTLTICASRRCSGPGKFGGDPVLGYGQVNEQGGFRCRSKLTGMTCMVMLRGKGFGKGFLINRDGVTRVGP